MKKIFIISKHYYQWLLLRILFSEVSIYLQYENFRIIRYNKYVFVIYVMHKGRNVVTSMNYIAITHQSDLPQTKTIIRFFICEMWNCSAFFLLKMFFVKYFGTVSYMIAGWT